MKQLFHKYDLEARWFKDTEEIPADYTDKPPATTNLEWSEEADNWVEISLENIDDESDDPLFTEEDIQLQLRAENLDEYTRRLTYLMSLDSLARAEIDENYSKLRKDAIKATLEVKNQEEYPVNVVWDPWLFESIEVGK